MFMRILKEGIVIGLSLFVGEMVVKGIYKAISVAQEKRDAAVASKKPQATRSHKKGANKSN